MLTPTSKLLSELQFSHAADGSADRQSRLGADCATRPIAEPTMPLLGVLISGRSSIPFGKPPFSVGRRRKQNTHLSPFPRKFHPFSTDSTRFLKALVVGSSPIKPIAFNLFWCSFLWDKSQPQTILPNAMRKIGSKRGWSCAMAIILWASGLQLGLNARVDS